MSVILRYSVAGLSLALAPGGVKHAHAQSYTLTTLATFNGAANGASPITGVTLDSSGNLYGTTGAAGAGGFGTVFEIAAETNTLTTIAAFNGNNGNNPTGGITLDGRGNLYGTTYSGGANNYGTVFSIAAGTNTIKTLVSFDYINGYIPYGGVTLDSSGNLYGTTNQGGTNGGGTVFKIAAGTNMLTTIANFNGDNGDEPFGGLTLDSSGNLYGTTTGGGANNDGTVFMIAAGTNTITTLFAFNDTNGKYPDASLTLDSSGNLYGTTGEGGANGDGTVFKIASGSNALTTLATFNGANGGSPEGILTLDSSGSLYGTTEAGGANGDGTVFKIATGANSLTTLAAFSGSNGANPVAGLTLDISGNLYGTTYAGGANSDGTVFELTAVGSASAHEPAAVALLLPALGTARLARIRIFVLRNR